MNDSLPAFTSGMFVSTIQSICRLPLIYGVLQRVAQPTTSRFRLLLERHVRVAAGERVLDLACGVGNYRNDIGGDYVGADINPAYIAAARGRHTGQFDVMDCCALTYPDGSFDHVVSIAATHHLDDEQLDAMVAGALRVCRPEGAVHIIDAVLPVAGNRAFKRMWFRMDAGRFPRTTRQLRHALTMRSTVLVEDIVTGPLHDCAYFRIGR